MALGLAACSASLVALNAKPWSEIFTSGTPQTVLLAGWLKNMLTYAAFPDPVVIEILQSIMPFFCLIAFIHAIEVNCDFIPTGCVEVADSHIQVGYKRRSLAWCGHAGDYCCMHSKLKLHLTTFCPRSRLLGLWLYAITQ